MAVVHTLGARIMTGLAAVPRVLADPGEGGGMVRVWSETASVVASDATSTVLLARIPSNARILGASRLAWDDLASAGAPTLDIGIFGPTGRALITDDPDALNDGLDPAAAAGSAAVIKDHANYGKRLWEFVAGQTSDPKCDLDIKVSILDAATNQTGDVSLELFYTLD